MKLLILQSSPASCHFLPPRSKFSPQHPVHKHLQHTLDLEILIRLKQGSTEMPTIFLLEHLISKDRL
jgi:hypothetical protein